MIPKILLIWLGYKISLWIINKWLFVARESRDVEQNKNINSFINNERRRDSARQLECEIVGDTLANRDETVPRAEIVGETTSFQLTYKTNLSQVPDSCPLIDILARGSRRSHDETTKLLSSRMFTWRSRGLVSVCTLLNTQFDLFSVSNTKQIIFTLSFNNGSTCLH